MRAASKPMPLYGATMDLVGELAGIVDSETYPAGYLEELRSEWT